MRKCVFYLTLISFLFFGPQVKAEAPSEPTVKYTVSDLSQTLNLKNFTLKTAWAIPQTEIKTCPEINLPAWGARFNYFDDNLEVNAMTGTFSTSGSISKLKTPALSPQTQAITNSKPETTFLKANLPKAADYSKPQGFFISVGIHQKDLLQNFKTAAFLNTEGDNHYAIFTQFKLSKKTGLSFSGTGGIFSIENRSSSWFSPAEFFPETKVPVINFQGTWTSPFFTSKESLTLFQNQNREEKFTISTENQIKYRDFLLNGAFFCSSDKTIWTADSARLKTLWQFKINPQLSFYPSNRLKIQKGLLFMAEQKIQSDESIIISKRLSAQINLTTKNFYTRALFYATGKNLKDSYCGNLYFSASNKIRHSESLSYSFLPDSEKQNIKFSQNVFLKSEKSPCINCSITTTLSSVIKQKELDSTTFEIKTGFRLKTKPLVLNANTGVQIKF